jgi:YqxM protein
MNMKKKVTNFVLNKLQKKHLLFRTNEEGSTIRKTRLRKFRTINKKLIIAAQIVAIWYFLILSGSYLTSNTGAAFNDVEVIENSLHANWDIDQWDKSSLDFDNSKVWSDGFKVSSTIKNSGEDMTFSTWRFYLFKVVNGSSSGDPVATGVVPNIAAGQLGEISATVGETGVYRFAVRRPLDRPGNNKPDENGYSYIWSDNQITVSGNNHEPEKPTENEVQTQTPNETSQPIDEATVINWGIKDTKVSINLKNPSNPDFSHLRIYTEGQEKPILDKIKNQKVELDTTPTTYRIVAVDKSDTESKGIKITVSQSEVIVN